MLQHALLTGLILTCSFVVALVADAPTRVVCSELQHRFAEPKGPLPPISGIIALGGARARIVTALQLAAAHPEAKLVVTGASMEDEAFARRFEPRTAQLLIEPLAKSTFENALFTRQLVSPKPDERWVIVTSAVHMPRAIGAFREAGFKAVAWPIYDLAGTGSAIGQATWHEVFGLLEYWALGRINSLFPAPIS